MAARSTSGEVSALVCHATSEPGEALLRKPEKQCSFLSLRCFETMVDIKPFGFLSECMNHNRPHPDILSYPITA